MQINRIFGITYLLLNHEHMTAKMLSEKFNVSIRTIYRDIDKMSQLGIPIYTERGKRGGVSLLSDFVLSKVLLDTDERKSNLYSIRHKTRTLSSIFYHFVVKSLDVYLYAFAFLPRSDKK